MLESDDGSRVLLYPGCTNVLYGDQGSCKSFLAQVAAAQEIELGNDVVYLDYEGCAEDAVERLLQLGVDAGAIERHFYYVAITATFEDPEADIEQILTWEGLGGREIYTRRTTLAVIDGVTEAMAIEGLDPNVGTDVATFLARLAVPLGQSGAAVLLIDHSPKESEGRGRRFPIGSERKLSGITGAAYSVDMVQTFGRGRTGVIKLRMRKDRRGHVARLAAAR